MEKNYETILQENRPMIFSIISKYNLKAGDYALSEDDLFQEGCIALYSAYTSYKEGYDAKFSTYAFTLISRRIERKLIEYMKPLIHESYSLDCVGQKDYFEFYAEKINNDEQRNKRIDIYKEISNNFYKTLTKEDLFLIKLRQEKTSYEKIMLLTRMNKKQIDNKLYRLRRKYKDYAQKEFRKLT